MVKKKKHDKDKWYHLAKEQGYRSRAAFKLIQLNRKFDFLSSARVCVDLCAAPGGWCQVAVKNMPVSSIVIGVDLLPIRPIRNVITLKEDITTQHCRSEIKKHLKGWKADVVLHDGAPNVGISWVQDAYSQAALTLSAVGLAADLLMPGGTFVTKVFRSRDYNSLLYVFNKLFDSVTVTKPPSSRNTSAEIFVVCKGFLAPKHLDPRLLDPKHVFKELDAPAEKVLFKGQKTSSRHRTGYKDNVTMLYSKSTVCKFIAHENPVEILADVNALSFTPDEDDDKELAALYDSDKKTNEDIRTYCDDLKLLAKKDIRTLLKWRMEMRKKYYDPKYNAEEKEEEEEAEQSEEVDPETITDKELSSLISSEQLRKKKNLKKERRKKIKAQHRIDMKMDLINDEVDAPEDTQLFALSQIKSKNQLRAIHTGESDQLNANDIGVGGFEDTNPIPRESDSEGSDSDEDEEDEYDRFLRSDNDRIDDMESVLDEQYKQYLQRMKQNSVLSKKTRKALAAEETRAPANTEQDTAEYEASSEDEENPLVLHESTSKLSSTQRANQWFSQGLFTDVGDGLSDGRSFLSETKRSKSADKIDDGDDSSEDAPRSLAVQPQSKQDMEDEEEESLQDESSFETVPVAAPMYESDSSMDDEERAELLAMATLVKTGKRKWSELVDDGYNRYAFNDDGLPQWFVDDESKHNKPQAPVTKEEVEQIKLRNKMAADRPSKKVMEATARKKMKAKRKMLKMKEKAETIANDTEMSESAKKRALEKLYNNQLQKMKPNKVYVVRKKAQKGLTRVGPKKRSKNTRIKVVDPRMKKDKRGENKKKR